MAKKSLSNTEGVAIARQLAIQRANEITAALAEAGIGPDLLTFAGMIEIVNYMAQVNGIAVAMESGAVEDDRPKSKAAIGFMAALDESKPKN